MDITRQVYKKLTGQRRTKNTMKSLLADGKKAFGDKWKELASESGISDRTLRRIRAGGKPSKKTLEKIAALAKREEVRKAAVKPAAARRLAKATSNGASITIKGMQGPVGAGAGDYRRDRHVEFFVPPEAMEELEEAYLSGNEEAIQEVMAQLVEDYGWDNWNPSGGWEFGSIDDFDFRPT